ncbi:phage tail protein [Diaphorobacter sp. HDW4A]|uniref:phage tail protein n=1 Tax=Diaphorobacter sp. HDW4A TaxID=2714924 RepID=UPI00140B9B7F|nr:tail fiber protein [Diaphorobacter sp. HDW4A]QIL80126.1 phage tail protein [Diaphorobacter sp. HDW4A]
MEGYLAQIIMWAANFAPRGWAFCQGQILSIAQNTALFSLLGTTYGGNGQTTFALPDLRGRVPIGAGQGPGLPDFVLGQVSGELIHTLLSTEMPAHVHQVVSSPVVASTNTATLQMPVDGAFLAAPNQRESIYIPGNEAGTKVTLGANAVNTNIAGGNQPFSLMQPSLGINFIICMEGIFPSRN